MPDDWHLVWMGLRKESDQLRGMSFLRAQLKPALAPLRLQRQPFDHVLRREERVRGAFAAVCFYVLENPVRAGLVGPAGDWPYSGAVVPGYPRLDPVAEAFWPRFWRLYGRARAPDAGEIVRPFRAGAGRK
jgi:hypothetical protein